MGGLPCVQIRYLESRPDGNANHALRTLGTPVVTSLYLVLDTVKPPYKNTMVGWLLASDAVCRAMVGGEAVASAVVW